MAEITSTSRIPRVTVGSSRAAPSRPGRPVTGVPDVVATIGIPGKDGPAGPPGKEGPPGPPGDAYGGDLADPGDLTLIFDNKLIG